MAKTQQIYQVNVPLRKSNGFSNIVATPCDVFRAAFLPDSCSLIGQFTVMCLFLYVRGNCHGLEHHQKFTKKIRKILIPITPVTFTANRKAYYSAFIFCVLQGRMFQAI